MDGYDTHENDGLCGHGFDNDKEASDRVLRSRRQLHVEEETTVQGSVRSCSLTCRGTRHVKVTLAYKMDCHGFCVVCLQSCLISAHHVSYDV
jgi:type III secretory pathway component EscU